MDEDFNKVQIFLWALLTIFTAIFAVILLTSS